MKEVSFSIIVDESTDVACIKHLCICVRYFSNKLGRVVSQFCGLVQVTSTTAEVLYKHVKDFLKTVGIDIQNCMAIATDGASNMCGKHNSVYALMKKDLPNLLLFKCVCHSLHLACSHA